MYNYEMNPWNSFEPMQQEYYLVPVGYCMPYQQPSYHAFLNPLTMIEQNNALRQTLQGQEQAAKEEIQQMRGSSELRSLRKEEQSQDQRKEKDRNMISNSLKVFRKYVKDRIKTNDEILTKIIRKNNLQYSSEKFEADFDKVISKRRNYFGIKFLAKILKKTQRNELDPFSIVFRTLAKLYYSNLAYSIVLTSKKITGKSKYIQLIAGRKIYSEFFNSSSSFD